MIKQISNSILCCLIIFVVKTFCAFPQSASEALRFQKITSEQGLPHNFVRSITQDRRGFMWFGTNYGLARYDGYDFKVFQPDAHKPNSIAQKSVDLVFADSKDNLWISFSTGGVSRMDLNTEKFTYYAYDTSNTIPISNEFSMFYEDNDSNLWAITPTGIFIYNNQADKFIYALSKARLGNSTKIGSFADDGCGNIWFTKESKVWILNKKTFDVVNFESLVTNVEISGANYTLVYSKDKGEVWIGTNNKGIFCYNVQTHVLKNYLKEIPNLISVFIDKQDNLYTVSNSPGYKLFVSKSGNLSKNKFELFPFFPSVTAITWVNLADDNFGNVYMYSPAGLARFNFKSGIEPIESNILIPNTISNDDIEKLFIDKTDNLWITPQRQGLNKADLRQKPFNLYSPPFKSLKDITKNKNVTSIYQDSKGNVWIGKSSNGVSIYDKATGKYYNFATQSAQPLTAILEDSDGNIWLGWDILQKVKSPDFSKLDPDKELSFTQIANYNVYGTKKIVSDKEKNLWFASVDGLMEFDKVNIEIINHSVKYDSQGNINGLFRTVFVDSRQIIWAGTNSGGLVKYNKSSHTFTHYLNNPENPQSISSNTVYDIFEDKDGYLWIGTRQGLEKFNPVTEKFEPAGIGEELSKRSIFSVLPDLMGNFWMSSDIGIIRYNIESKQSSFYGQADGLQNNEFSTTASFINKSGEIFFGGTEGLISFKPAEIKTNPILSKTVITNLRVFNRVFSPGDSLDGRVLLARQIWETKELILNYDETDFTIEFSALHFSAPEKIKYYYMLEGFNANWIETDSKRRFATYTGLPPGEYTFRLKATNNDGLMCQPEDEVSLSIIITPPFWQTIWFKLGVALVITIFILLFISYRLKSLREQNILLDKKVKERTLQLEQANQYLEDRSRDLEEANTYLEESQEEVRMQKEEILSQYEFLENTNRLLKQQQDQIITQNHELDKHRNQLEFLVEERTKELENALVKAEEADKLKTSFLTNMSHEIRTPMNAIIGFSSLLKEDDLKDKHDEFIDLIESNGMMLINLINNIFELSSIETHQVSNNPTHQNLLSLLKVILLSAKQETDKKNLVIKLDTESIDSNFALQIDENHFKQVFTNLLSNATKFTSTGTITFGVKEISENISFYVKDTGIGIPADIGDKVYERFFKIESNLSQLYRGTGLGLAICKGLVSLWNGEIWYESEPGKGSTFYFTVPQKAEETESGKISTDNSVHDFSGKCILIAEDEESNYKLLVNYLIKSKVKIIWAKDGQEAINLAKESKPDVILMDIKMPVMDGIEASFEIKKLFPSLPIIAQTAYAMKNEIQEILNAGLDSYLVKPIKKAELLEMVKKYIHTSSSQK
jgi:signal transduction histidine kinase/ligand-binding sensor domain-containing protein/ActR/RegA family two-component response regulator